MTGDAGPVIDLPRNLSRPARGVYFAACLLADEVGEVIGGQRRLREVMGYEDRDQVRVCVAELEHYRYLRRVHQTSAQRLFVVVLAGKSSTDQSLCETCGIRPKQRIRGAKECAICLQAIGRRLWKAEAVELWAKGVQRGDSDWKIAYAIHATTKQPLWGRSEDGQQGSGSGEGEGVIPAMVAMGLFPESMAQAARSARKGGEIDEW